MTLKLLPPEKPVSADQTLPCGSVYSPPPAFTRMVAFSHNAAWPSPFAKVTLPAAVPWLLIAAAAPPLETYLSIHRPILEARSGRWTRPVDGALWVSKDGSPMTQMALYDRIRARTKEYFGVAINPHLFRDAAATTLAIADPAHVRIAAPLLGHRTFALTERHCRQSRAVEAHRSYVDVLFKTDAGRHD